MPNGVCLERNGKLGTHYQYSAQQCWLLTTSLQGAEE